MKIQACNENKRIIDIFCPWSGIKLNFLPIFGTAWHRGRPLLIWTGLYYQYPGAQGLGQREQGVGRQPITVLGCEQFDVALTDLMAA